MAITTRPPFILTGQALNSLCDSGYDLSAALGEPIDNSLEANANHIWIRLDEAHNSRGKKHIHRIVIADDGCGMDEMILHHYLQLGFGTRYMSKDTIGKYGVGAKLAALNYAKRIDVWSRADVDAEWLHVYLDLPTIMEQEKNGIELGIEPPQPTAIPDDLYELFPSGIGTVVVWSKVYRLEEGQRAPDANALRVEIEQELSRIFRYFLHDGIVISVNGKKLLSYDPLMLMERGWADFVLQKHSSAHKEEKAKAKDHFPAEWICNNEPINIAGEEARVSITLYPREAIGPRGAGGDRLRQRLRIPDNQGRISFVRLNREISYTNVPRIFPRGVEEPDRYIGIEVDFRPSLDDYFGVRNVKRGVEPHGELRDKLRAVLTKYLPTARGKLDEIWGDITRENQDVQGEHGAVVEAVKEADRTMPKARAKGLETEEEREQKLEDLAKDVVGAGDDKQVERKAYLEKIKELPFVVESVDAPGTFFIDVQHVNGQVLIRLNTRHRFYREMWAPLREIAERDTGSVSGAEAVKAARRTIEALTLLLIAYGKAESMHDTPYEQYSELRNYWGMFADTLMGKIKGVI